MAKAGYVATTGAAVALTAATAKTVLGVLAPAQFGVDLISVRVGIDTATTLLVELCANTFGANAPGTNSTSVTIQQAYGRSITTGFTAARTWTTEPTTITVLEEWEFTAGGTALYDLPLATSYDSAVSVGFSLRLTAGATANARAVMRFERC
jgi:hypothetical protein